MINLSMTSINANRGVITIPKFRLGEDLYFDYQKLISDKNTSELRNSDLRSMHDRLQNSTTIRQNLLKADDLAVLNHILLFLSKDLKNIRFIASRYNELSKKVIDKLSDNQKTCSGYYLPHGEDGEFVEENLGEKSIEANKDELQSGSVFLVQYNAKTKTALIKGFESFNRNLFSVTVTINLNTEKGNLVIDLENEDNEIAKRKITIQDDKIDWLKYRYKARNESEQDLTLIHKSKELAMNENSVRIQLTDMTEDEEQTRELTHIWYKWFPTFMGLFGKS